MQQAIVFSRRGGRRAGAGRKPRGARALVSHAARAALSGREPVLVTMKMRREIWNLRARRVVDAVLDRLGLARDRNGMRIVHFSVQRDHVHLIIEAGEKAALSRGVQGLSVRLARALNRMMKRRGKVLADRFHSRVLPTPRQVRHAIAYVLCNARKHGLAPHRGWLDPCSSARAFDGWAGAPAIVASAPVAPPRSWLMRVGWRRGGGPIWIDHDPDPRPDELERWR